MQSGRSSGASRTTIKLFPQYLAKVGRWSRKTFATNSMSGPRLNVRTTQLRIQSTNFPPAKPANARRENIQMTKTKVANSMATPMVNTAAGLEAYDRSAWLNNTPRPSRTFRATSVSTRIHITASSMSNRTTHTPRIQAVSFPQMSLSTPQRQCSIIRPVPGSRLRSTPKRSTTTCLPPRIYALTT